MLVDPLSNHETYDDWGQGLDREEQVLLEFEGAGVELGWKADLDVSVQRNQILEAVPGTEEAPAHQEHLDPAELVLVPRVNVFYQLHIAVVGGFVGL